MQTRGQKGCFAPLVPYFPPQNDTGQKLGDAQASGEKIPSLLRSTGQKAPAILWTRGWWEVKKEGQKWKVMSQSGGKHVSQGPGEGAWARDADV